MFTLAELEQKSEVELALIAQTLGLRLNPDSTGIPEYIQAITDAQDKKEAPPPPKKPTTKRSATRTTPLDKPKDAEPTKYRIIVHNQEGSDSSTFVKVQVNGVMFAIPREKEVVVPASVVEVLNNAIATRFSQNGRELVTQSARRFPFTLLGEAR